jgi:hypothetical protein
MDLNISHLPVRRVEVLDRSAWREKIIVDELTMLATAQINGTDAR